jgi:hypothetical protein
LTVIFNIYSTYSAVVLENIHIATVKTSQHYSFNPPTHPKRQFDVLRGNLNMDVAPKQPDIKFAICLQIVMLHGGVRKVQPGYSESRITIWSMLFLKISMTSKYVINLIIRTSVHAKNRVLVQSRSPSMPVRRLRVGIALEKSNWFTLDFKREFYACSATVAKYKQSI